MEEMRYTISDAAKMVKVESHVLRYWEDELSLDIPRNERAIVIIHSGKSMYFAKYGR